MIEPIEAESVCESKPKRRVLDGARACVIVVAVAVGILIGRAVPEIPSAIAADPAAEATATRSAELTELNDLRTKVAQPAACTPAPTSTPTSSPTPSPTPTLVPPVPAGQEARDANGWAVTVLSIQSVPSPDGIDVTGKLMQINLTIENTSDSPQLPPFNHWRLVDQAGNRYSVDGDATTALASPAWLLSIGAHKVEERVLVFDVASDAGTTFVLENEQDPTFRIEVSVVESRG
jgi:hypothetical protein